jgi:hypothetical protein
MRLWLMQHAIQRDNEMRIELVDHSGQPLSIPHNGIVVRVSRGALQKRMLVNSAGMVTNLARIGLAGTDGERMVLTLRGEVDGGFTVVGFRQLLDS